VWINPWGRPKAGVYAIVCASNGSFYAGSTGNLWQRKQGHWSLLRHGRHHNRPLQNDWRRYGEDAFRWEVLEILEGRPSLAQLRAAENLWLQHLRAERGWRDYNIAWFR
jgi:group I intron endonuclease